MAEQLRLFEGKNLSRQFEPVGTAVEGARSYTGGAWSDEGLGDVQVDHQRGYATAQAYKANLEAGGDNGPELRASYDAMREHVGKQYDYMTRPKDAGGMGLRHEVTADDPYPDPADMARDLAGGRIKTFATTSTGGHEYFADEDNDRFRAVHDVFGHAATGRGFSRHGEEAAYLSHKQMFPPEAHAALASETRGQNSYLNYGPGGFASQEGKLVRVPKWVEGGPMPAATPAARPKQFTDRPLF